MDAASSSLAAADLTASTPLLTVPRTDPLGEESLGEATVWLGVSSRSPSFGGGGDAGGEGGLGPPKSGIHS